MKPTESRIGPWLVALGAGLWGTETAWRVPLSNVFDPDVLVWWEHVLLVAIGLPFMLPKLGQLRRVRWQTLGWLVFSGVAGSAVGTVFLTLAFKREAGVDVNATIIGLVLNIQPVLSTAAAYFLFRDRLARGFFGWAALAIAAGAVLGLGHGGYVIYGIGWALLTALCWGLSTVAGRGVMVEMPLALAAGMRFTIGLVCMTIIVLVRGRMHVDMLWPAPASAATGHTIVSLVLLATVAGAVPLVVYFKGLSLTRASTAGYFEMMQTVVASVIGWAYIGDALEPHQVAAGVVLIGAVAMVQRVQEATSAA